MGPHNIVPRSVEHLARVGGQFLRDNFGLFALSGAGLAAWLEARRGAPLLGFRGAELRRWRAPLLAARVPFPAFVLACNLAVMALALGLNPGNDVLCYHQLISPFILWLALQLASRKGRWQWACLAVLLANLVWLGAQRPAMPKDQSAAWGCLDRLIAAHRQVFAAPHLSHLLARHGQRVYDAGQTEHAWEAYWRSPARVAEKYRQRTEAFLADIRNKVVNEQFDLVLVCRGWAPLMPWEDLQVHYVCQGPVSAPMTFGYWMDPYPLEMWIPASQAGRADKAAVAGKPRETPAP